MNEIPGTRWTSITKYVDIDTGEIIKAIIATDKQKYIITKTIKHVSRNEQKTRGIIIYTRECRKQPQQQLNFNKHGKN